LVGRTDRDRHHRLRAEIDAQQLAAELVEQAHRPCHRASGGGGRGGPIPDRRYASRRSPFDLTVIELLHRTTLIDK
jgi:hypothetical protein